MPAKLLRGSDGYVVASGSTIVCTDCDKKRPVDDFYLHRSGSNRGLRYRRCKSCHRKRMKRWTQTNTAKAHGYEQNWRAKNKVKLSAARMRLKYGISVEDIVTMYEQQEKRCAICRKRGKLAIGVSRVLLTRKKGTYLVVDHCHKTGVVRGLCCFRCNLLLGQAKDDADILANASAYLRNAENRRTVRVPAKRF